MNTANLPVCIGAFLSMVATTTHAMSCPESPKQVNKDVQLDVDAAVGRIGPVKGGELVAKTRIVTQDLLGKLPDANKVYLEQMLFSAYCTALRDDPNISDGEKAARLQAYAREVRGTIAAASLVTPKAGRSNLSNSNPALRARWKLAWVTINEKYDRGQWNEFNRENLLKFVKSVDVSMDKNLVALQNAVIDDIIVINHYGYNINYTGTRLGNDLNELRQQIRKQAILAGADIN